MTSNVVKNDDKTTVLEVAVDGADWEGAQNKAFEKIRKSLNIKGFRKGKVPANMAKRLVPAEAVMQSAVNDIAENSLREGLNETGIEFVEAPVFDVKELTPEKAVLTFTGEEFPEAELGQYDGFGIKKEEVTVTDEEVDEAIRNAAARKADMVLVEDETPAKDGDEVTIDFKGSIDGVPFDGGSAEDQDVVLGSHRMIPGFEEQIVGMKTGENKDITVTFPEDYPAKDLAGKDAVFNITVKEIKEEKLPEIDDEFAKSLGIEGVNTVDELKDHVRKNITAQKDDQADQDYTEAVVKKAVENAKVDIPAVMIDREAEQAVNSMLMQIQQSGLDPRQYLQLVGKTVDALKEEARPEAEERVKTTLVLDAVAKKENLETTVDEIEEQYKLLAENFGMPVDRVKSMVSPNLIQDDLLREKAIDVLKANQ